MKRLDRYFLFMARYVERVLWRLSDWAARRAQAWSFCPDCGRNRFSGKPCK